MIKTNKFSPDISKSRRGQSLVELALTLMVLLILLAGAFDLGSAFLTYIALRDAAEEGAIYGSISKPGTNPPVPSSITEIVTRVRNSSTSPLNFNLLGFTETCAADSPNGICVTFSGPPCTDNVITVTVRYHYSLTMPLIGGIIGSQTIPLLATVNNVILTPACSSSP